MKNHKENNVSEPVISSDNKTNSKVGGITRMKNYEENSASEPVISKVGGITRMKKS